MASPAAMCPARLNAAAPPFIPSPPAALQQPAPPQLPAPPMALQLQPPAPQWAPHPLPTQWAPHPPAPWCKLYPGMPPPPFLSPFPTQSVPPPPPPPFAGTRFWGLPAQGPGMAMQGAFPPHLGMPMPHGAAAMPPAAAGVHAAQPPHAAGVPQHGGEPPRRAGRTMRGRGAKPWPRLDVPLRRQRAAAASAATRGAVVAVGGGDGAAKGDSFSEPSPRSVLGAVATSPPLSPSIPLPAAFPYDVVSSSPPPEASAALPPATANPSVVVTRKNRRVGRLPGRLRRPPRQAPGGAARQCRAGQKPRLAYDPNATSGVTTLMIRNIPNSFTRDRLINIVDQHCAEENDAIAANGGGGVRSEYDFLYVPIDFCTGSNMGFAFVNLTTPDAARRLWRHLHGHRWEFRLTRKCCAVDCASIQGLEALEAHFAASRFACASEDLLPVRFDPPRDGARPATGEMITVGHLVGRGDR
ncbi:hypothetical protein ACP4OV_024165 [Aristida adscensionis]